VIVLEKDTTNPVQELVVGKSIPDSLRSKPHIAFTNVEPEEGSDFYDDYITHNLSIPEEIKTKKTSGEVELSFEINDEGKAVNIKVEKSLCQACDKEAIRLVQEGPKLKKKNKQKGKLKIRF
jgi:TonB family protein